MGRAFEYRKATKMKRWGNMARVFTKLGKQITIAVRESGPEADTNPRLRVLIQQSKKENMPKENVERAIKKAISKDEADYKEVVYEGYGPNGIAIVIETATDNPTRTVANVRMYFTRNGGTLGTNGSVSFMFDRKALFKISSVGLNREETEFELIDFGAEEFTWDDENSDLIIQTPFAEFGNMQKGLEDKKIEIKETSKVFIPSTFKELTDEQEAEVLTMIEKMEDDDDIVAVYHNAR